MAAASKKEYSLGFIIGSKLQSSFSSNFKAVEKQLLASQKAVKNCQQAWGDFGKNAAKLIGGVTAAAAAVGTAAWKMADDIAQTGDRAAKISRQLGMTTEGFQELEYAFNLAGLGGDEFVSMMTKMDNVLTKAAYDSEAWKNFGEEFGIDARKLAGMDAEKRIKVLSDYLNSLEDPIERDRVAMELFGKSGQEMVRVLEMGSEGIVAAQEEFRKTGATISDELAKQSEAYNDMKERLTTTVQGVKVQLLGRLIPIFTRVFEGIAQKLEGVDWDSMGQKVAGWVEQALPAVEAIARGIGDFVQRVWNGVNAAQQFVGGWGNLVKIIGVIMSAKTALSGFQAVLSTVTLLEKAGGVIRGLFTAKTAAATVATTAQTVATGAQTAATTAATAATAALNVAMAVGVIGAIIAVVAAIVLLVKNWDKVKAAMQKFGAAIYEKLQPAIDWIKNAFAGVKEFFAGVWEGMKGVVQTVLDAIRGFISGAVTVWNNIVQKVKDFFTGVWNAIEPIVSAVMRLVSAVIKASVAVWKGIFKTIVTIFQGIWNIMKPIVSVVLNIITGVIKGVITVWKGIFKVIATVFRTIWNVIKAIVSGVLSVISAIVKAVVNTWIKIFQTVWKVIKVVFNIVKTIVTTVFSFVSNFISTAINVVSAIIENVGAIAGTIFTGIQNVVQKVFTVIGNIVSTAAEFVNGVFTAVGDFFRGIWEGIVTFISGIWETISAGIEVFITGVTEFFSGMVEGIHIIITKITGFFSEIWEKVKKTAGEFKDKILGIFKPIGDFFSGIGDKIASIFGGGKKTIEVEAVMTGEGAAAVAASTAVIGHAKGGIFTKPHLAQIAEAGDAEAVVPINNKPASRAIWQRAGEMAGFTQSAGTASATTAAVATTAAATGTTTPDVRSSFNAIVAKFGNVLTALTERFAALIPTTKQQYSFAGAGGISVSIPEWQPESTTVPTFDFPQSSTEPVGYGRTSSDTTTQTGILTQLARAIRVRPAPTQSDTDAKVEVSMPVKITIEGNADASTAKKIEQARDELEQRMRAALPRMLADINRDKRRTSF